MSSSTSALPSAAATYFAGVSNYSQDLNNAIQRAVAIAGLPIQLMQNNVNHLTNQQDEMITLSGDFNKVQSAVSSLASAAGSMLTATVSDPTIATATVAGGATAGSYTLQVTNLGSYSNSLSDDGMTTVSDPASQNISTSNSYTLTVTNGAGAPVATPISFSGGSLNVLAQAINEANAGVQATVVDVGSNSAPDYRLSLQSSQLGPVTMQLNDGANDLLTGSGAAGVLAQYTVNGKPVQSNSDSVTLAPGVTVQLTGSDTSATSTVTVAADPSGIGSALQSLVSSYNSAITELNNNRGQTDVALAGEAIVYKLTNDLRGLANYATGSGNISSLASLGVSFNDTSGQLSFNQSTFDSATAGQTTALTQFLGSAAGGGFLQTATNAMTGMLDPTNGVITQAISTTRVQITSTNTLMTSKEAALTLLQANLTQEMAASDALIYSLQQQSDLLQSMFTAQLGNQMQSTKV
jgi:flagellar hook-associated protein 2